MDNEYENQPGGEQQSSTGEYSSQQHQTEYIYDTPYTQTPPQGQSHPWDDEQPPQYTPTPPKKKRGTGFTTGKVIALALCCSLIGGLAGAGGVALGAGLFSGDGQDPSEDLSTDPTGDVSHMLEGQREENALDISQIDTSKQMTAAEVYALNVNSTVGITTSITTNYWGYQTTSADAGSGFILTDDGYVLTNYHVIEDSDSITVSMYDGTSYQASLIGYDESNDIAVLKIDAEGLTPVVLGDSDSLNVGDSVIAIGNPLGELTFSLTAGTVSAKDRQVTMSTGVTMNLIQTDCAINSGNSGGALFNLYGEVVGITNAKYSSSSSSEASIDNIGFAIPISHVRNIVESIIEKGYISKPYIGVSVTDVSAETQSYGLPQGAAVRSIVDDSPAAEAGLQVNDIITHIDGTAITGTSDLGSIVSGSSVGDKLELTIYRQGQTLELTVTVGEQIQSAIEEEEETAQSSGSQQGSNSFPWDRFYG